LGLIFWVSILFLPSPTFAKIENPKCLVPYSPEAWRVTYCMAKLETDDLEMIISSPCNGEKAPQSIKSICDQNKYWKSKWCEAIKISLKNKPIDQCIKDKKLTPIVPMVGSD
jgi:hypothetical protein